MPKSAGHDIDPAGKSPNPHAARATAAIAAPLVEATRAGKSKDTWFWGNASVRVTESPVNVSEAEQIPVAGADCLGAAPGEVDDDVGVDVVVARTPRGAGPVPDPHPARTAATSRPDADVHARTRP